MGGIALLAPDELRPCREVISWIGPGEESAFGHNVCVLLR